MIAYSLRKGVLLLPRPRTNGKRFTRRVWPPSNARWIWPPVRAFCPFVPRPAVLPRPEPCPRPTRLSVLCEPGVGRKSESFTDNLLYLHQVHHLADHSTYSRMIFMFNRLLQFAEAKRPDGRFLILRVANRTLNIFNTYFCHCCSFRQLSTTVAAATTTLTSFTTAAASITSLARATTPPYSPALTGFLFTSSACSSSLLSCIRIRSGYLFSTLLANDFSNRLAAPGCFLFSRTQFTERLQASLNCIRLICAAQRLCQDITHTDRLHDRSYCPTCNYTGTGRRRLEHNLGGAKARIHHVR